MVLRQVNINILIMIDSQMGGLMGLCLGFSLLSFIELAYWFTFRLARNAK